MLRYGGNTSCVEVRCGDRLLVFDSGTGIRNLGEQLVLCGSASLALFYTHMHLDHVMGLPFFAPLYLGTTQLDIYGQQTAHGGPREALVKLMTHPLFPVELEQCSARLQFFGLKPGQELDLGDGIKVITGLLNHPGDALGYRIEYRSRAVAHVTDTEHFADRLDQNVVALCKNVDVMTYDASYSNDEYCYKQGVGRKGWGHSTWEEAIRVAVAANAKKLVLFHHDFTHTDADLDSIRDGAMLAHNNVILAQEGMEIDVVTGTYVVIPRSSVI